MTDALLTGTQTERTTSSERTTTVEQTATSDEQAAPPSVRVIEAVADATETDLLAMAPFSDVIDADALDRLVAAGFDGFVQFAYAGRDVTVHGDGAIVVGDGGA